MVGHDWGAAVAWYTAMLSPDRVRTLTVISVAHPRSAPTLRSYEMAWYQLFYQFAGVAEATIQHDDWAWFRMFTRGDGDQEQWLADLSRPGALTASLNWYRANLAPRLPAPRRELPPVTAPVMGIWSTGDHYLDGEMMRNSGALVSGPWRYEEIPGASHWVPLDAPVRLTELLLEWLRLTGVQPPTLVASLRMAMSAATASRASVPEALTVRCWPLVAPRPMTPSTLLASAVWPPAVPRLAAANRPAATARAPAGRACRSPSRVISCS